MQVTCLYAQYKFLLVQYTCLLAQWKGGYLVRCGEVEFKIGTSWKLFRDRVQKEFTTPLKAFLEVDVKNAMVSLVAWE